MLDFEFLFDEKALEAHLDDISASIAKELEGKAPAIREAATEAILDKDNWNPEAVYSHLDTSQAGEEYDLHLSGQLLETIGSEELNTITTSENEVDIGIGNIGALDRLVSRRREFGSRGGGWASAVAPYWRFVVFGHRPPRGNFTFVREGSVDGKDYGVIRKGKPKMKGTPPTYMFENGMYVAEGRIDQLVDEAIGKGLSEADKQWR